MPLLLKQLLKFYPLSQFIFRGHSTREPASSRVTNFILRAYTGTGVGHSQRGKNWERFWKNAGEWTGRVEIPGSMCSMYQAESFMPVLIQLVVPHSQTEYDYLFWP